MIIIILTINEKNTVIADLMKLSLNKYLTVIVSTINAKKILINNGVKPLKSGFIIFKIVLTIPRLIRPIKATKKEYLKEIILKRDNFVAYHNEKLTATKTEEAITTVFIISCINKLSIFII